MQHRTVFKCDYPGCTDKVPHFHMNLKIPYDTKEINIQSTSISELGKVEIVYDSNSH